MNTLKFKTNINCGGCLSKVTPFLNEEKKIEFWKVDLKNPDKILEVQVERDNEKVVLNAVSNAGFEIEKV